MIRSWGEKRVEPKLKNHVELVELLGIADLKKGNILVQSSFLVDLFWILFLFQVIFLGFIDLKCKYR